MSMIFGFIACTADGYHEGSNGEFDWPVIDEDFERFSVNQLHEIDTLLFGRTTYEGMAAYWPTDENQPEIAKLMNTKPKLVASTTLTHADWQNTSVVSKNLDAELRNHGTVAIFGSAKLTGSLLRQGLLDELRIMTMPVLLGGGRPLFPTLDNHRVALKLTASTAFASGNVLNVYRTR